MDLPALYDDLRRLEETPAARLYQARRRLRSMLHTFRRNAETFLDFLDELDTPTEIGVIMAGGGGMAEERTFEASRHFHNFAASAGSLVDHMRRYMQQHHGGTPFHDEYRAKVRELFEGWEVAALVDGFRDYLVHRELPIAASKFVMESGVHSLSVSHEVVLIVPELLKWDRWPKVARTYLEELGFRADALSLRPLILSYAQRAADLYQWWDVAERASPKGADVDFYLTKRKELRELQALLSPPTTITLGPPS